MRSESLPVAADCPPGRTGLSRPRAVLADQQKPYLRACTTSHLSHLIPLCPGESHLSHLIPLDPGESHLSRLIPLDPGESHLSRLIPLDLGESHLSRPIPLNPGESHLSHLSHLIPLDPGESRLSHSIQPRNVVVRRRPTRPIPARRGSCRRAAAGGWARPRGRIRRRSRSRDSGGSSPARPGACSRRERRWAAWPSPA